MHKPVVVIPNLDGGQDVLAAINSLLAQTKKPHIIVVDNASTDGSVDIIREQYGSEVEIMQNLENMGYSGGVNPGFERAIELGANYTAPFNDDAQADKKWLELMVAFMDKNVEFGAVCPKVLKSTKIDTTGDFLTIWGLPYPRGRDETDRGQYDIPGKNGESQEVFSASGAASLYRVEALKQIGLMDQNFFAYYEDVDLSFRMRLAGWKVGYEPRATVQHKVGMTSGRMKGFTTLQTTKNLPLLLFKNLPSGLFWRVAPRFTLAYTMFIGRAILRGHGWYALKGMFMGAYYEIRKIPERRKIQSGSKLTNDEVWRLLVHDLPPNALALRKMRSFWWNITGRRK